MGSLHSQVFFNQLFNMKSMILIAVFLAVAAAAPQDQRPAAIILKQTQNHDTEQHLLTKDLPNPLMISFTITHLRRPETLKLPSIPMDPSLKPKRTENSKLMTS